MSRNKARKQTELNVTCCIVGGGPAGMMLGVLLARSGLNIVVLEKHGDFFRDAVAAANLLTDPLKRGKLSERYLKSDSEAARISHSCYPGTSSLNSKAGD